MPKFLILLSLLGLIACDVVISRNSKIQEIIDQLKANEKFYDEVIVEIEEKMKSDYQECTADIKEQNCSDSQIWEQQRSKNSKNITNLQQKIKKQNKTIDAIMQLNKQEVTKKNLTMAMLFPQIEKLKNDVEMIENMLFLVEDTYLNLDNEGQSILLLFDHQFTEPKAQLIQKSLIQLMMKHREGPPPTANETQEEEGNEGNDSVPLIDEDIFNGEVDQKEVVVGNLFTTTDEDKKKEAELVADDIPDGVDVKEHDQNQWNQDSFSTEQQNLEFEDLRIYEVKEDFKASIKSLGKIIHDRLNELLLALNTELDMKTQSVADLEKAIIDLHHKHAKQIVQIYIETKRLQQQIFELDDQVMALDAQIYDCLNSDKLLQECEDRKGMDQVVLDDLKTEKSFNDAALIELQKLIEFDDKNVIEPPPKSMQDSIQAMNLKQQQQVQQQISADSQVQARIQSIKSEEALVDQQLEDKEQQQEQLQEAHAELRQEEAMPEHLAQSAEFNSNILIKKNDINASEEEVSEEEDQVLEAVNNELENAELPTAQMESNEEHVKNLEYLEKRANPILSRLTTDLLIHQPQGSLAIVQFIKEWCDKDKNKDQKQQSKKEQTKSEQEDEEEEEDSFIENEEDEVAQLTIEQIQQKKRFQKQSVSAEVYGQFNKKASYVPKVIEKTQEQKERIRERLTHAFMFSALDEKEQAIVINAFEEKLFKEGDIVIQQGENGDVLYLVNEGELDCRKWFVKGEEEKFLKTYIQGEAFGELALLYNAPRAATIIAKTPCSLFALDRETFNHIVKESAQKKRESYEELLSKIEILQDIDPYERNQIADALKRQKYQQGEYIVKEGEDGNQFFFLEEGEAIATKNSNPEETVYDYKSGDYFGELALLRNKPRAANIIAKTDVIVCRLDRDSFQRLLGPLEDVLKRNFARYSKFAM